MIVRSRKTDERSVSWRRASVWMSTAACVAGNKGQQTTLIAFGGRVGVWRHSKEERERQEEKWTIEKEGMKCLRESTTALFRFHGFRVGTGFYAYWARRSDLRITCRRRGKRRRNKGSGAGASLSDKFAEPGNLSFDVLPACRRIQEWRTRRCNGLDSLKMT